MFVEKIQPKLDFQKYHVVIENAQDHAALMTVLQECCQARVYNYGGNGGYEFAKRLMSMIQTGGMGNNDSYTSHQPQVDPI